MLMNHFTSSETEGCHRTMKISKMVTDRRVA